MSTENKEYHRGSLQRHHQRLSMPQHASACGAPNLLLQRCLCMDTFCTGCLPMYKHIVVAVYWEGLEVVSGLPGSAPRRAWVDP